MPHLPNLERMYNDMQRRRDVASSFDVIYNTHRFRCIFIADESEKTLYISSTGENAFTVVFNINDDFEFNSGISKTEYDNLVHYLELRYNPDNKFVPANFLAEFDAYSPNHVVERPTPRERAVTVNRATNLLNGEEYFKGWIKWTVKNPSPENFEKTKTLVGAFHAKRLRNAKISSAWSHNPEEENLARLDAWIAMMDK